MDELCTASGAVEMELSSCSLVAYLGLRPIVVVLSALNALFVETAQAHSQLVVRD